MELASELDMSPVDSLIDMCTSSTDFIILLTILTFLYTKRLGDNLLRISLAPIEAWI